MANAPPKMITYTIMLTNSRDVSIIDLTSWAISGSSIVNVTDESNTETKCANDDRTTIFAA